MISTWNVVPKTLQSVVIFHSCRSDFHGLVSLSHGKPPNKWGQQKTGSSSPKTNITRFSFLSLQVRTRNKNKSPGYFSSPRYFQSEILNFEICHLEVGSDGEFPTFSQMMGTLGTFWDGKNWENSNLKQLLNTNFVAFPK